MKLEELKKLWIVNWIWGKNWFNLSLFFKNNIAQFKEYIPEKWEKLFKDIEDLSVYHDISYYNWNTILEKIKADYSFALWVITKLHWTTFYKRLFVFLFVLIILLIKWNQFYNWWEKKYITLD